MIASTASGSRVGPRRNSGRTAPPPACRRRHAAQPSVAPELPTASPKHPGVPHDPIDGRPNRGPILEHLRRRRPDERRPERLRDQRPIAICGELLPLGMERPPVDLEEHAALDEPSYRPWPGSRNCGSIRYPAACSLRTKIDSAPDSRRPLSSSTMSPRPPRTPASTRSTARFVITRSPSIESTAACACSGSRQRDASASAVLGETTQSRAAPGSRSSSQCTCGLAAGEERTIRLRRRSGVRGWTTGRAEPIGATAEPGGRREAF